MAGLILINVLPWVHPRGGDDLSRDDVQREGLSAAGLAPWDRDVAYTQGLTRAPITGMVGVATAGFLLILLDAAPLVPLALLAARVLLTGIASFFALHLAVLAARWFGLYLAHLMTSGEAAYHLHIGLYVLLSIAAATLLGCLRFFARATRGFLERHPRTRYESAARLAAASLAAAAATLLLLPLLPVASDTTEDLHLSEVDLMQYSGQLRFVASDGLHESAQDLSTTRLLLWLSLAVSAAGLAAALFERTGRLELLAGTLLQTFALNAILVGVGLVFAGLLYFKHVGDITLGAGVSDFRPLWNWFLPAGLIALAYLTGRYLRHVTWPFWKSSRAAAPAPPAG